MVFRMIFIGTLACMLITQIYGNHAPVKLMIRIPIWNIIYTPDNIMSPMISIPNDIATTVDVCIIPQGAEQNTCTEITEDCHCYDWTTTNSKNRCVTIPTTKNKTLHWHLMRIPASSVPTPAKNVLIQCSYFITAWKSLSMYTCVQALCMPNIIPEIKIRPAPATIHTTITFTTNPSLPITSEADTISTGIIILIIIVIAGGIVGVMIFLQAISIKAE
jgi:hypothetical protein